MSAKYNTAIKTKWFTSLVNDAPDQSGKNIVITGTTSGTGYACAKALATKGANVFLLNRESSRSKASLENLKKEVPNGKFTAVVCDLQDFASVRSAANDVTSKVDRVDTLILNAGVMALEDKATKDGYDLQSQTNVISHFLLTKELYPLLGNDQKESRVVSHSSIARFGKPLEAKYFSKEYAGNLGGNGASMLCNGARWQRYQQTKLANCVFTYAMKDRLEENQNKNIKMFLAHPGLSATNLQNTTQKDGGLGGVGFMRFAQSSEDGACGIFRGATDPNGKSGDFYGPHWSILGKRMSLYGPAKKINPSKALTNKKQGNLLWKACEEAVGEFKI